MNLLLQQLGEIQENQHQAVQHVADEQSREGILGKALSGRLNRRRISCEDLPENLINPENLGKESTKQAGVK